MIGRAITGRNPVVRDEPSEAADSRPDGKGKRPRSKKAKKARRRNILIASFAVFIMLTGLAFVGGTYLVNGVTTPDQLAFPATTTIFYSDGTELAKLGEMTRYPLKFAEMNDAVVHSIVASEDNTFWTNSGIDFKGIMRAAWNNVSGGQTQGASTITQQYARLSYDLSGATYARKWNEAVLAWRLNEDLDKEQILEYYLNSVPFGRQAYGIEAAAKAFFGKTANRGAKPEEQITVAEAMALVAMVKQPEPDPVDPVAHPGYDPTIGPEAEKLARERWDYVRGSMVDLTYLTRAEADQLTFPKDTFKPYSSTGGNGLEAPAGLVVNHVLSELTHTANSPFKGKTFDFIRNGGYQITTTIHPGVQQAAEAAADETRQGSALWQQRPNLQAALVAVEPGTGRILGYYGGHDGKGNDYAGFYYDDKDVATGVGRFPPGSSMKVYTLAAALDQGISLNSYWQWTPHDMERRTGSSQVRNSSKCLLPGATSACTLLQSTIDSLNVPFYAVTLAVGADTVLKMARDAGIDYMWTDDNKRQDLRAVKDMKTVVPEKFDPILGIGQYAVTVMDHANGMATFAAGGLRSQAHFVTQVMKGKDVLYRDTLPDPNGRKILRPEAVNDLTWALTQVKASQVKDLGWDTAGKTGTWELNSTSKDNAHAWMVGFDKKLAAAVWVGNKGALEAIKTKNGEPVYGSGLPGIAWASFMKAATKALNQKKENTKFNPPSHLGDENPRGSVPSPTPSAPPPPTNQRIPVRNGRLLPLSR